jgi:hypothetical protein
MRASFLNLRLFAEGLEIPIVTAQLKSGYGRAAQVALQVLPTDEVLNLLPKTLLHVFYWDDGPFPRNSHRDEFDQYKLLGSYELFSIRYVKRAAGNLSIVLIATDTASSSWDDAKMYFKDGKAMSPGDKAAAYAGAHIREVKEKGSAAGDLYQILEGSPAMVPGMKGLLAGALALLESVHGVSNGKRKYKGTNDFFTAAEKRLKISQMVGASAKDDSSAKLFQDRTFKKWLRQILQKQNRMVSFRSVIDILMGRIYHQYSSIAAPHFNEGGVVWIEKSVRVGGKRGKSHLPEEFRKIAEERVAELDREIAVAQTGGDSPTARPIAAEKAMGRLVTKEIPTKGSIADIGSAQGFQGGTRSLQTAAEDARTLSQDRSEQRALQRMQAAITEDQRRSDIADDARRRSGSGAQAVAATLISSFTGGQVDLGVRVSRDSFRPLNDQMIKTRDHYKEALGYTSVRTKTVREQADLPERLIATVFSPDLWFCPPPKCNVIFPDQYSSFQFVRDFTQEVTRLRLSSRPERLTKAQRKKGKKRKKSYYWAPVTDDLTGTVSKKSAQEGKNFLMDHEVCSGIIMADEAIPDIAGFQKLDKGCTFKGLPYMQRTANYLFYNYRLSSRTGTLTMDGFSPRLVPGPALIFGRFVKSNVQDILDIEPVQYLASIRQIEHTIGQQGGQTSTSLTHIRTQREQAEFLGQKEYQLVVSNGYENVEEEVEGTATLSTDFTPEEGAEGHVDVTLKAGQRVRVHLKAKQAAGSAPVTYVPTRLEALKPSAEGEFADEDFAPKAPGDYSVYSGGVERMDVSSLSGGADANAAHQGQYIPTPGAANPYVDYGYTPPEADRAPPESFSDTVKVRILRRRKRTKLIDIPALPFEEVIRPAWLSHIYGNREIGAYYKEMFGVTSIIDAEPTTPGVTDTAAKNLPLKPPIPGKSHPCIPDEETEAALASAIGDDLLGLVKDGATIMQSVDTLVAQYRVLVEGGGHTTYLDEFTARPVATMRDMGIGTGFSLVQAEETRLVEKTRKRAPRRAAGVVVGKTAGADLKKMIDAGAAAAAAQARRKVATDVGDAAASGGLLGYVSQVAAGLAGSSAEDVAAVAKKVPPSKPETYTVEVSEVVWNPVGEEGFHSRAYGPYDAMEGLFAPGEKVNVNVKVDPRGRRYAQIGDYIRSLQTLAGILG